MPLRFYNSFRNVRDALLHQLWSNSDDSAQNGDLKILRLSNISCNWFKRHYNGYGILHDANSTYFSFWANFPRL